MQSLAAFRLPRDERRRRQQRDVRPPGWVVYGAAAQRRDAGGARGTGEILAGAVVDLVVEPSRVGLERRKAKVDRSQGPRRDADALHHLDGRS